MTQRNHLLSKIDHGHRRQLGQYLQVAPARRSDPVLVFFCGLLVGLLLALAGLQYTLAFA